MKITLGIVGILIAFVVTMYVTSYNKGVNYETVIKAQYTSMENTLAQYSLKIKEAAQIPSMQTEDLGKLFSGALESRYGSNGSQAAMQWIKEQNPNLDQQTYIKLQQMMEAGRNKFSNAQDKFIDQLRSYEAQRKYLWSGTWLRITGYPTAEFIAADYKIISSSHAKKSFETGIDEGIQLR